MGSRYNKKPSSRFNTVSTYVLTTGWAFPSLGFAVGWALPYFIAIEPLAQFTVSLCLQALGYIAGMFHSFAYIRNKLDVANPRGCVTPSIVAFLASAAVGFATNLRQFRLGTDVPSLVTPAILLAFYFVVTLVFVRVTKHGFYAIEKANRTGL